MYSNNKYAKNVFTQHLFYTHTQNTVICSSLDEAEVVSQNLLSILLWMLQ